MFWVKQSVYLMPSNKGGAIFLSIRNNKYLPYQLNEINPCLFSCL